MESDMLRNSGRVLTELSGPDADWQVAFYLNERNYLKNQTGDAI